MRFVSLFALGTLAAVAPAQLTNVLPTAANGVAGGTANAFPWATAAGGWPGLRILCIYDSSHFTAAPAPITAPILITNVKWRANDTTASWTGGTYGNATLGLGTAPIDYTAASTTWATNLGLDYTTVHNGPVTVQPGTGSGVGVPGPYVVDIQVTPPFVYDPSQGDLIVDTNWVAGAWGGGSFSGMDVLTANVLASRVYSSSLWPNANGVDAAAPVIEITYTPFGGGTVATNTLNGAGCTSAYASFYEDFATSAAFDLANTAITLLNTGGSYIALPGITAFVPPSATATTLLLSDDSEQTMALSAPFPCAGGPTSNLTVCSNGFVSIASGNGASFTPSAGAMLGAPQTGWWNWHDYNPAIAGSGQVKFEQIGGIAYITWDGVWDFGGTSTANANTFQWQFDTSSGAVHLVCQTMSTLGNNRLVGYSPGGPSASPGNRDISATIAATFTLGAADVLPLALNPASRPVTGTTWNLNVSNVPAAGIGIDVFGLADPGINDLGFLGAPGCGLRSSLDVLNAWAVAGSTHGYSLSIPNVPALVNLHVFTTSAVFGLPPVNALGAITANGIDGRIGDV